MSTFDELVSEALSAPVSGWDFSWLAARSAASAESAGSAESVGSARPAWRLPWSYRRVVAGRAAMARTMLDMGTGGGEVLSGISPLPPRTVATEAWPPNVPVAAARLRPLAIGVIQDEGAPDNVGQDRGERGRLPFGDGVFDLVVNRHEAFRAAEVSRILAPGGIFVTQQVDFHSYDDLCELVGLDAPEQPESWLPLARYQVADAGLTVRAAVRGAECGEFGDVAALVYYLRVVSWAIPGFSVDACRATLRAAHEAREIWPVVVRLRCFLLIATKP